MSSLSIDHVIIVVSDLSTANQQFSQLGFLVIPGGVHSGGLTHNALIPFSDGTYLELLATTQTTSFKLLTILKKVHLLRIYTANQSAINRRIIENVASGVGMNDFALLSEDLDQDIKKILNRGQKFTNPISGGRRRPDGQEIVWRTAVPQTLDIPFLIEDITPFELRVSKVDENAHSNGVVGIKGISIFVPNHIDSIARYRELLGVDPKTQPSHPQPGTQSTEFNLDEQFVSISSPLPDNTSYRHILRNRSSRPIGLQFKMRGSSEKDSLSLTYFPDKGATLSHSSTFL